MMIAFLPIYYLNLELDVLEDVGGYSQLKPKSSNAYTKAYCVPPIFPSYPQATLERKTNAVPPRRFQDRSLGESQLVRTYQSIYNATP